MTFRYVKTTANATVDHLSKYLALRIALEERQKNGETEDRGREDAGGGGGVGGSGEGSSLGNVSEKQYTIYITTRGGQFSVSNTHSHSALLLSHTHTLNTTFLLRRSTAL